MLILIWEGNIFPHVPALYMCHHVLHLLHIYKICKAWYLPYVSHLCQNHTWHKGTFKKDKWQRGTYIYISFITITSALFNPIIKKGSFYISRHPAAALTITRLHWARESCVLMRLSFTCRRPQESAQGMPGKWELAAEGEFLGGLAGSLGMSGGSDKPL